MKKSIRSSQFYTYDQYFFYDENAPYIEKENKQAKKWTIVIETETTFTQKFRPALFLKYLDFELLQINQPSNMYICTKAKYVEVEVDAKWQRRKKNKNSSVQNVLRSEWLHHINSTSMPSYTSSQPE